jgi:hypothetical protein
VITSHPLARTSRSLLLALACAAALSAGLSCGGSPPPATTTGAPTAEAASAPPPSSAAASTPPAGSPSGGPPTARVLGVAVAQKADHYTRVTVSFTNPSDKPCKIQGYTLSWDQGSKDIPLENFTLAPGKTETRAMRVHAGEGDISRLVTPEGTRVEVRSDCGAR